MQNTITPPSSFLQTASEVERWAGVAMATAVVAYGLSRRSFAGVAMAAAAAPLAYRGITGAWPGFANGAGDTRVALGGHRGTHVREAIRVDVPLHVVYEFWSRLENLPRFMTHLETVTDLGGGRSRWVARSTSARSTCAPRSALQSICCFPPTGSTSLCASHRRCPPSRSNRSSPAFRV